MDAPIPVKKMEDLVRKTGPYDKLIDRSGDKFRDSPWLNRWADKKDLQSVAHAFAKAGDTVQLQEKIDKARGDAAELKASVMETDRKISAYKELAVSIRNYGEYRKIGMAYGRAKDKERFFEAHESQLMIFEAAEREIRSKGLDPEKVSYEQVMDGIEKLKQRKNGTQSEYRAVSKDLRDMEKQMEMMQEYLKKGKEQREALPISPRKSGQHEIS